jgi:hypothetical protein
MTKIEVGKKVNCTLTAEQRNKLGIQNEIQNPCTVAGHYTNGVAGYYLTDANGKGFAVADRYDALKEIS